MITSQKYHIVLRCIGIVITLINLLSCFTLDIREWLVYFDPWFVIAVVCPAFVIALPALPYLMPVSQSATTSVAKLLSLIFMTFVLFFFEVLWFIMIAIAMFCRDFNWNFYWPWEERIPKIVILNALDLNQWVWIYFLEQPFPANPLIRECVGIALLVSHLFIVPLILCQLLRRYVPQVNYWRILAFIMALQLLFIFPGKMCLRYIFNLKYFVSFPEYNFNI